MRFEVLQRANRYAAYHAVGLVLGLAMFFITEAGTASTDTPTRSGNHSMGHAGADPAFDLGLIFAESASVIGRDFALNFVDPFAHPNGSSNDETSKGDAHLGNLADGAAASVGAPATVPEPSTGLLLAAGLLGLAIRRRKRLAEPSR